MNEEMRRMLTAVLLCMAILFAWQHFLGPQQDSATPADKTDTQETSAPRAGTAPAVTAMPQGQDEEGWRLHTYAPQELTEEVALGAIRDDEKDGYKAKVVFDPTSASVSLALLSEHKFKVTDEHHGYPVLAATRDANGREFNSFMLGMLKLKDRPEEYDLSRNCWVLKSVDTDDDGSQHVAFEATLIDENDSPALRVIKTFSYNRNDYMLDFHVQMINESQETIEVESLDLYGPAGLAREDARTDMRFALAAYVGGNAGNGADVKVEKEAASKLIVDAQNGKRDRALLKTHKNDRLQWIALANKYFAATIHPAPGSDESQLLRIDQSDIVTHVTQISKGPAVQKEDVTEQSMALTSSLQTERPLAAGMEAAVHLQVFLGPIDKDIFDNNPLFADLHYEKLMTNQSCFCAVDWLTFLLIKLLKGTYLVFQNYGVAIIILVLLVRTILHPIQVRSQLNMMKMQKFAPKMEEIKKKYGNNQQEMQKKMMELQKEQGMMGNMVLGCLPMFLQMPIWIALYTAVNSNVAVRHQGLLPASWHWLNDLSAPDRLIPFSLFGLDSLSLPLIGSMMGEIDAFNLLPILGAVALYLQTKLSPQSKMTAATNPQAAQQQKMMLVMMPVMMLLFLYNASSGFNLYFMASLFGGLIEQHFIRKHLKKEEEKNKEVTVKATTKVSSRVGPKKKKPKPPVRYN